MFNGTHFKVLDEWYEYLKKAVVYL